MPIHEYPCRSCGNEFETLVRASDTPTCVSCGSDALDKELSVFAAKKSEAASPAAGPCGASGHPGGPGSGALN